MNPTDFEALAADVLATLAGKRFDRSARSRMVGLISGASVQYILPQTTEKIRDDSE